MDIAAFSHGVRFGYGYALEKAIRMLGSDNGKDITIIVYGNLEEYCKRMSELRWLLASNRDEGEVEKINTRIRFK